METNNDQNEEKDLTWEKLKSAGSKMLFTPIGTPLSASPVEGEKEELPDVIKFLLGESSFKSCWFGSESIPFGEKGRYWWRKHLRKYTEAQASRIKALEELLEAAENALKCVPLQGDDNGLFGRNVYIPGFNEALEAYNKLKH